MPRQTSCYVFCCEDPANPYPIANFATDRMGDCHFAYGRSYLDRQDAYAIDPIHLPLVAEQVEFPRRPDNPFGVLSDAGPNAWGMKLTSKILMNAGRPSPSTDIDWLLESSHYATGCLGFAESSSDKPSPGILPASIDQLSARLADVVSTLSVDADTPLDVEAVRLLNPGSSLGGVRPKTVVLKDGNEYIAKFSRQDDLIDVPTAEYATMQLARRARIALPEDFELLPLEGRHVLIVQRFDRAAGGSRIHYISASSLIGNVRIQPGGLEYKTRYSYAGIAEAIRPYSARAVADSQELFRRMVFNILVGNVDDHMRNHGFIRTPAGTYELSPVFDIVPQLTMAPQSIGVGADGPASTITNALSQCGRFFLVPNEAQEIVAEVKEAVSHWRTEFRLAGLSASDIHMLEPVFAAADEADAMRVMVSGGTRSLPS